MLLVAEVVSSGSETTDRIAKVDLYAKAHIGFYWRIEQAATGVPLVYTYVLDPAGIWWEVATNPGWRERPDGTVELGPVGQ